MSLPSCPPNLLTEVLRAAKASEEAALAQAEGLLERFGNDARLHFLRGSLLAGLHRYEAAHEAMSEAVRLAPDDAIARFQLGFLELTSGDSGAALVTWRPLRRLHRTHMLRLFAEGLTHMTRDDFPTAIALLEAGIKGNMQNQPLSDDMSLLVQEMKQRINAAPSPAEKPSSTQMLLEQFNHKTTKH